MNFESFSTNTIVDKTFQALGFCISATEYLEKKSLFFTDITNLKLIAKLAVVDNLSQVITDFKEKIVKKKNKCVAKTNEQFI